MRKIIEHYETEYTREEMSNILDMVDFVYEFTAFNYVISKVNIFIFNVLD